MNRLLLVGLLLLLINSTKAQHFHFKQYSLEEGLPQSEVLAMAEDQFGYIWLGTNGGGLSRFNGKTFEVYTRKDGLPDNIILGLHHDENYNLWIGSPKGLLKYNGIDFIPFFESDTTTFADGMTFCETNGSLWLLANLISGKRKLYRITDTGLEDFSQKYEQELTKDNYIFNITPNQKKGLLISTYKTLYNYSNNELSDFAPQLKLPEDYNLYRTFLTDRNQTFWLNVTKKNSDAKLIIAKPNKGYKFVDLPKGVNPAIIRHIKEDRDGGIWVMLYEGGILHLSNGKWRTYNKKSGLGAELVMSMLQDAEGNIWLGTSGAGLKRYSNDLFVSFDYRSGLTDNIIRTIFQDSKGTYYFADAEGGFNIFDGENLIAYPKNELAPMRAIKDFYEIKPGHILFATLNGLWEFNGSDVKRVDRQYGWNYQFAISNIEEKQDTLFFATYRHGLIKSYNGSATFYNTATCNMNTNQVDHLSVDSKNRIWMCTMRGVMLYENGEITNFLEGKELHDSYIIQAAEDKVGNIWFATFTGGLIRYDGTEWDSFNTSEGISSDNIYSIIADADGNIWAGAQNGIDKVHIDDNGNIVSITNFDRHDGFIGIENNSAANFRDKDNNLWFGTVNGVMRYNPSEKRTNFLPPYVYIRDIRLGYTKPNWYKKQNVALYDSIVPWFHIPNQLELANDQNHISFTFDALCYTVPEKIQYKWKLEPVEQDWIQGQSNQVAYPSLPPGAYKFRVKAANNSGIWNDEDASFEFTIHPAWYQTFWLRGAIIALLVTLLYLLIRGWQNRASTMKFEMETVVASKTKEIRLQKIEIEDKNRLLEKQKEKITLQANSISNALSDLEKLTSIGKNLTANLSTDRIFDLVYRAVQEVMDIHLFGFGLFNPETNSLDYQNLILNDGRMPFTTFSLDDQQRLSIHCLINDKEIFINDFDQEYKKYVQEIRPVPGDINSQSIIYIPLKVSASPFGVITVQSANKKAYSGYHLNFIRNIANYASIALENARAFKQLDDQRLSLENANKSILIQNEEMETQTKKLAQLNNENLHLLSLFTTELERPLTSSVSIISSLKSQVSNLNPEQEDALHHVLNALWQIKEIVNQVSEIKHLESDSFDIKQEEVEINDIFRELTGQYEDFLQKKNIELKWETQPTHIISDQVLVEKVLANLISNAIKFTYTNSQITLSIRQEETKIVIGIKDEGPGISEEEQTRLFTKFQKLSAQPTGDEVSSGLGLYIVKKYVDLLKGNIWCESQPDQGATFYIALPL